MQTMMSHGNEIAASAVKSLRVKALLDEVPKKQIAEELGISRPTAAKRLKSDDIPLSEFIKTARLLNVDPIDVLDRAIRSVEESPQGSAAGQTK